MPPKWDARLIRVRAINVAQSPFYLHDEDNILFNERFLNAEIRVMIRESDVEITQTDILEAIKVLKHREVVDLINCK